MSGLWIVLILIGAVVAYGVMAYNGFITLRNRVKEAWSDIDVQLKRRYELIPNLVETVRGYANHERETLEKVIQARNMAMAVKPDDVKKTAESDGILTGALKSLFALSENYPQLQANQNFMELHRDLRDTEDKLQAARRFYNGNVMAYNTKLEQFPGNIIAAFFHFERSDFFELKATEEAARQPVEVKF